MWPLFLYYIVFHLRDNDKARKLLTFLVSVTALYWCFWLIDYIFDLSLVKTWDSLQIIFNKLSHPPIK